MQGFTPPQFRGVVNWLLVASFTLLGFSAQAALNAVDQFNFTKLDVNGNVLPVTATDHACVKDNVTGLVWEVKANDGGLRDRNRTYTFDSAAQFANDVNAAGGLCGFTDWRVPNPQELVGIVNYSTYSPKIDTNFFPDTSWGDYYWTTFDHYYGDVAWTVDFDMGYVDPCYRDANFAVRLVRGSQSFPDFQNNNNGTTTDNSTGLMWGETYNGVTWDQVQSIAQGSSLAGYNDWRVPNVKEMQSAFGYIDYSYALTWMTGGSCGLFDSGYANSTELDYNNARTVWLVRGQSAATFALNVAKTGNGTGTVTSNPAGINCGGTCSANFVKGVTVTLTATPTANSIFAGWSGDADCSDGQVTMDAAKNCIATFNIMVTAPSVVTNPVSNILANSVQLNGSVASNGATATASFECGLTTSYGNSIVATPNTISSNTPVAITANLNGLSCNTIYHCRAKAINSVATSYGVDQSFTTAACPPTAVTLVVTNDNCYRNLNGQVTPNGANTSVNFEYGPTTNYGNIIAATPSIIAANAGSTTVTAKMRGQYHYRVKAENSAGIAYGEDFVSPSEPIIMQPPPPTIVTLPVTNITRISATLNGTVEPAYDVSFEYGQYGTYSNSVAAIVTGTDTAVITAGLTGLSCNNTYNYRVKVVRRRGQCSSWTYYGDDSNFTTERCPGPATLVALPVTNITSNGATLNVQVHPNGKDTTVSFDCMGDTSGKGTFPTIVAANAAPTAISVNLNGLACNNWVDNDNYYCRIYATNKFGTSILNPRIRFASAACHISVLYDSKGFRLPENTKWSNPTVVTANGEKFLANSFWGYGNESNTLTLNNLQSHRKLQVEFDLHIIQSWDGNGTETADSLDKWQLTANGVNLFLTTFSNNASYTQAFPNQLAPYGTGGSFAARTGAFEHGHLGFGTTGTWGDTTYRMSFTFKHMNSNLVLKFTGMQNEAANNEGWGLDNVKVMLIQ